MSIFKEIFRGNKFTVIFGNDTGGNQDVKFSGLAIPSSSRFGGTGGGNSGIQIAGIPLQGLTDTEKINFVRELFSRYPVVVERLHISNVDKIVGGTIKYEIATYDKNAVQDSRITVSSYQNQSNIVEVPANILLAVNTSIILPVKGKASASDPANEVVVEFYIKGVYDGTQQISTPMSGGSFINVVGGSAPNVAMSPSSGGLPSAPPDMFVNIPNSGITLP